MLWAADALCDDDTTVAALARRLGVDWPTLWGTLKVEARRRADDPNRLVAVESLSVDEHVWRPGEFGAGREATCVVDLTRDANVQVRARLFDLGLGLGRSGPAYSGWLDARPEPFRVGIKHAALDPFRGYANALRDSLPVAVQVLEARSTSSSSAPRSSTRSAAASSSSNSHTAVPRTTRSTRSAGCSGTAWNTSLSASTTTSTSAWS